MVRDKGEIHARVIVVAFFVVAMDFELNFPPVSLTQVVRGSLLTSQVRKQQYTGSKRVRVEMSLLSLFFLHVLCLTKVVGE